MQSGTYKGGGLFGGAGIGGYIFDKRVDGIGSSLTLSLSFVGKYYMFVKDKDKVEDMSSIPIFNMFSVFNSFAGSSFIGGQVMASYYYNFYKNFAVRVGMHLEIYKANVVNLNDYHYRGDGISIDYGISLGLAF